MDGRYGVEADAANSENLWWRSGDLPVQPFFEKYSGFLSTQITSLIRVSRSDKGRFAIVTNVEWDAVDALASSRGEIAGRALRP